MAESEHAFEMMLNFFIIGAVVYLGLMVVKAMAAFVSVIRERRDELDHLEYGILTVAQAIRSGDRGLSGMLESNLRSLSGQVFFWLCDEDDRAAIEVVSELMMRYPNEKIRLIFSPPCPEGKNPKVFKLIGATDQVSTRYFLVLDDDTHLPAATAAALVKNSGMGVVATGLPHYSNEGSIASKLLAQFVNNNSVMTYLSLLPIAAPISINGMCYVLRSEQIAIFPEIENHLTDDLALATVMKLKGGRIYQSAQSQVISSQLDGFTHYFKMMHRWHLFALLLLKQQSMGYRAAIFALHGWHPLLLIGLLLCMVIQPSMLMIGWFSLFLFLRAGLIALLQRFVFRRWLHRPLISLVSELLQPLHLMHAVLSRKIDWRGRKYHVFASDRFESYE